MDRKMTGPVATRLDHLVRGDPEAMMGLFAVRLGLFRREQLDQALAERDVEVKPLNSPEFSPAQRRPLGEILVERGLLAEEDVHALKHPERWDLFGRLLLRRNSAQVPAEVRNLEGNPGRELDEFILVSPLGRGGAGEVWKAWDRRLGRWVAIKRPMSRMDSAETWERLSREAQAAARLSHLDLVPIYRVGDHEGTPFIVMPLIEGRTLEELRLPLGEALGVALRVARAVQYAHEHGVVHRDLKPANIMVDGKGGVWVLDFGLAHLSEGHRSLTQTGAVVGTAGYMSPEQARGGKEAREAATDIYSLGATLYELVTGKAPFSGESAAQVVHQVIHSDPVPARSLNPEISRDVETILLKAMDKEPRQRYASAAALAEELARAISGEAVQAQRVGVLGRVARWVRRHPKVALLSAASLLGAAAALTLWARGQAQIHELQSDKASASARIDQEREAAVQAMRETARLSVDAALELRRRGEAREMRKFLPALERAYQGAVARAPGLAEVDYLMGRMYRALLDEEKALAFQDRALAKDQGFAPALYERIVLRERKYSWQRRPVYLVLQASLPGLPRARDAGEPDRPELVRLREGILRDAERFRASARAARQASAAQELAVQGILELHGGDRSRGIALLREAVAKQPLLDEAWRILAAALEGDAMRGIEPETRFQEALDACTEALSHDRGCAPILDLRGGIHAVRAAALHAGGKDFQPDDRAAEEDFTRSIDINPERLDAWIWRSLVRFQKAVRLEEMKGPNPLAELKRAEEDATHALARDCSLKQAWLLRAMIRGSRSGTQSRLAQDPAPDLDTAEQDASQALKLDASDSRAWLWRGIYREMRGLHQARNRLDPCRSFESALEDFEESVRLDPHSPEPRMHLGATRNNLGSSLRNLGKDPGTSYEKAEEDFSKVIERHPACALAWYWRGFVRTNRGEHRWKTGADPLAEFAGAEVDLGEAIRLNPRDAASWNARGKLRASRAAYRESRGETAIQDRDAAREDAREAVRIDPTLKTRAGGDR
jgi:serine/threonine-protein kinase